MAKAAVCKAYNWQCEVDQIADLQAHVTRLQEDLRDRRAALLSYLERSGYEGTEPTDAGHRAVVVRSVVERISRELAEAHLDPGTLRKITVATEAVYVKVK